MCVGRPKSLGRGQKWCERKSSWNASDLDALEGRERVLSNKLHLFAQPSLLCNPPNPARLKFKNIEKLQFQQGRGYVRSYDMRENIDLRGWMSAKNICVLFYIKVLVNVVRKGSHFFNESAL